jgi:16S rRNA processing protein RimM
MPDYRNIGKLVSTFGVKGEMVLQHHLGKKTSLKNLENVFVEDKKDEMLPYFIVQAKIKSEKEVYIKLEGISSKEAAQKLLQKELWLTEEDFLKYAGKSAPISFVGFHLINEGKDLGEIAEVIEQPHQVLCKIFIGEKEALIPIHAETLEKIDKKKKQLYLILPEGLLEIYR